MRTAAEGFAVNKDAGEEEMFFKKLAAENVKFYLGMFVGVRDFSAGADYFFG